MATSFLTWKNILPDDVIYTYRYMLVKIVILYMYFYSETFPPNYISWMPIQIDSLSHNSILSCIPLIRQCTRINNLWGISYLQVLSTQIKSSIPHNNSVNWMVYYPHFTDKEIVGQSLLLKAYSFLLVEPMVKLRASPPHSLSHWQLWELNAIITSYWWGKSI